MSDTLTFTWAFPALEVAKTQDTHQDVVTLVHWRLKGTWADFSEEIIGTIPMGPPGQVFTSFNDLTHEIVQGWVEAAIDAQAGANGEFGRTVADMKKTIDDAIKAKIAPTHVTASPPWLAVSS